MTEEESFWSEARDLLIEAVKDPGKDPTWRSERIREALELIAANAPFYGTVLVWHLPHSPPQAEYGGVEEDWMRNQWLPEQLDANSSFSITKRNVERIPPNFPARADLFKSHDLYDLNQSLPRSTDKGAVWIVWPHDSASLDSEQQGIASFLQGLDQFLQVAHGEKSFYRPQLGVGEDGDGLRHWLSLVKHCIRPDLVYFASVEKGILTLRDTLVIGATQPSRFACRIRLSACVGGDAFTKRGHEKFFDIEDLDEDYYEADILKEEGIRSLIVYPAHSESSVLNSGGVLDGGGVFYVAWRDRIERFDAPLILLSDIVESIGSLPPSWDISRSPPGPDPKLVEKKRELVRLTRASNNLSYLEDFLDKEFVKGSVIVVDRNRAPYVQSRVNELEKRRSDSREIQEYFQLPDNHGRVLYWRNDKIPPEGWPDFEEDVVTACTVILQRMALEGETTNGMRSRWIQKLIAEGSKNYRDLLDDHEKQGLGIFAQGSAGEVLAISWEPQAFERTESRKVKEIKAEELRKRARAEAIKTLRHQLTFTTYKEKEVGVILVANEYQNPDRNDFYEELRDIFGPDAGVRLVFGASYDSIKGVSDALSTTLKCLDGLRDRDDESHIVNAYTGRLESFIANPKHSSDLETLVSKTLGPLIELHDDKPKDLTLLTLCYKLLIHEKAPEIADALQEYEADNKLRRDATIKARWVKAQKTLLRSLNSPTDRAELTLAAYLWYHRHHLESLRAQDKKAREELEKLLE